MFARWLKALLIALALCATCSLLDLGQHAMAHDFGGNTQPDPPPEEEDEEKDPPCDEKPSCKCQGGGTGGGPSGGGGGGGGGPWGGGPPGPPVIGAQGKPVSLWNGAEYYTETDLVLDDVYPIRISRSYQSNSKFDTRLGYGWSFNFNRRLFEYPDDSVIIRYECGKRMSFVRTGGAYVTPNDGPQGELIEHVDGSFEYRYYDGSRDFFDANGRLIVEEDKQGHRHEFIYDAGGKLPLIGTSPYAVDPTKPMVVAYMPRLTRIQTRSADGQLTGVYVDFFYDADTGRVERLVTHDGREIYYYHDLTPDGLTTGNLIRVEGLSNLYHEYQYTSPHGAHLLTSMQNGATSEPIVNTYDAEGRVVQQVHGARVLDFDYLIPNTQTQVTRTIYDDQGQLLHTAVTTLEFTIDGYPTKRTDALGHEIRLFYDGNMDVERVEWWANGSTLSREVTYTHDAMARLTSAAITLDSGETLTQSWTYDHGWVASEQVTSSTDPSRAFRTEYTFYRDAAGRPTNIAAMKRINDDGSFSMTAYSYCTASDAATPGSTCPFEELLKTVDGPRTGVSDVTAFAYYAATDVSGCATDGACHRKGQLWKTTNALGQVTEVLRYDAAGRPVAIADANGVVTTLTYHPRGWLLSRTVQDPGPGADATTTYAYNALGEITQVTRPDGSELHFAYDTRHRLVSVSDTLGNTIAYTLDSEGNRLAEDTFDPGNTLKRTLSREFDALSRLETAFNAQGAATQLAYDGRGNLTQRTDALGVVTSRAFDDLDRLTQTVADAGGIAATTAYDYDAAGHLTQVTDPKGLTTSYTYDARGNLVALDSPDTGTTTYSYDAADNRIGQTDARGVTVAYSYDALNRLTTINYPTAGLDVTLHYDEADGITGCVGSYPQGRLTRIEDASGSTTYCYDYRGNVTQKTQVTAGVGLSVGYEYDLADRLTAITYPSEERVTFTRDTQGRLTALGLDGTGSLLSAVTHLSFGPINSYGFGNGQTLTKAHDLNYWVTDVTSPALDLHFNRDAVGNIAQLETAAGALREDYAYDDLYRLTGVEDTNAALIEAYTYDDTGNRLSKATPAGTENYTYPAGSHHLTGVAGLARTYDAAGNTVTDAEGNRAFTYDERNRLTAFSGDSEPPGATVNGTYQYNALGERVSKTATGVGTLLFVYDRGGRLLGEYHADGAVKQEYVYAGNIPVAILQAGAVYYIHADHLGTPRAVTDSIGTTIWAWAFPANPFGEVLPNGDPDGDSTIFVLNLRFPGQYFDAASGLHYNYFRTYEPDTGRYLTSDPIGLEGGLGTYNYAFLNPINLVDPLGLNPGWGICVALGDCRMPPLPPIPPEPPNPDICCDWVMMAGCAIEAGPACTFCAISKGKDKYSCRQCAGQGMLCFTLNCEVKPDCDETCGPPRA